MIISVNAQIDRQKDDTVIISDECIWSRPEAISPVKDLNNLSWFRTLMVE
jgi:hypothetical protein